MNTVGQGQPAREGSPGRRQGEVKPVRKRRARKKKNPDLLVLDCVEHLKVNGDVWAQAKKIVADARNTYTRIEIHGTRRYGPMTAWLWVSLACNLGLPSAAYLILGWGETYRTANVQLQQRVRHPSDPDPLCGCGHHISFHDDEGCHFTVTHSRPAKFGPRSVLTTCTCVHYVGPEPLPARHRPADPEKGRAMSNEPLFRVRTRAKSDRWFDPADDREADRFTDRPPMRRSCWPPGRSPTAWATRSGRSPSPTRHCPRSTST